MFEATNENDVKVHKYWAYASVLMVTVTMVCFTVIDLVP
jgi:hypothetical protein